MTNLARFLAVSLLFATISACFSGRLVRPIDPWSGFGATTEGGTDGEVVRVTTLAADGPGSLRHALAVPRPRLVVFEVGGVIDLQGRGLVVRSPHLTVAGQTAPDPGITLIRGGLTVETHDVIIQHLAVRPGDGKPSPPAGEWAPDALGVRRASAGPVHDVVFDHCSATWAVDENLSASGPGDAVPADGVDATAHDITLRSCLIAEGLSHATHPKGEHSKGTLVHDGVRNVLITGCLYAHNRERNPRLKGGTTAVIAGNVIYDWGSACVGMGARGNERMLTPAEAALIGNVAIPGPSTRNRLFVKSVDPGARAFLRDNVAPPPLTDADLVLLPTWPTPLPPLDSRATLEHVLRTAGSRPARRDPIDARIVQSVRAGTGRIIDSQEEVGGYPVRAATRRAVVVPEGREERRRWLEGLELRIEKLRI